jgi:hypothetical protein
MKSGSQNVYRDDLSLVISGLSRSRMTFISSRPYQETAGDFEREGR